MRKITKLKPTAFTMYDKAPHAPIPKRTITNEGMFAAIYEKEIAKPSQESIRY